jgi:hypothetical protein
LFRPQEPRAVKLRILAVDDFDFGPGAHTVYNPSPGDMRTLLDTIHYMAKRHHRGSSGSASVIVSVRVQQQQQQQQHSRRVGKLVLIDTGGCMRRWVMSQQFGCFDMVFSRRGRRDGDDDDDEDSQAKQQQVHGMTQIMELYSIAEVLETEGTDTTTTASTVRTLKMAVRAGAAVSAIVLRQALQQQQQRNRHVVHALFCVHDDTVRAVMQRMVSIGGPHRLVRESAAAQRRFVAAYDTRLARILQQHCGLYTVLFRIVRAYVGNAIANEFDAQCCARGDDCDYE